MERLYILLGVGLTQMYTFSKTHQNVDIRSDISSHVKFIPIKKINTSKITKEMSDDIV